MRCQKNCGLFFANWAQLPKGTFSINIRMMIGRANKLFWTWAPWMGNLARSTKLLASFKAYSRRTMLFWCLILGFVSLFVYKARTVWLKKLSKLLSNVSYKSHTLLWYTKKERHLHEISLFTFTFTKYLSLLLYVPKISIPLSKQT